MKARCDCRVELNEIDICTTSLFNFFFLMTTCLSNVVAASCGWDGGIELEIEAFNLDLKMRMNYEHTLPCAAGPPGKTVLGADGATLKL